MSGTRLTLPSPVYTIQLGLHDSSEDRSSECEIGSVEPAERHHPLGAGCEPLVKYA